MTLLSSPPVALGSNGAAPDDLFAHVLSANPFTDNRVSGPAPAGADVDNIHRAAFERLTGLAREAHATRRGLGAVLWGEAGVGKSHLLARLARWAEAEGHVPFVYLHNLQASPGGLPRSLLRAVVSLLTHGWVTRLWRTPLFRLAASFAHEAFGYDPAARPSWGDIDRAWGRLVDCEAAARSALVDRTAYDVLLRFFHSAYAAREGKDNGIATLAVRWLGGDYLDPSDAARLRLPPAPTRGEAVGLADNQQIKQVLVTLARLAVSARQPFLLGFDQVDNLDDEQMAALARFLEALLDAAPNLLVVSAGVQATLLHWRQARVIQDSAWDRLAQFEMPLQRLTPGGAERLVTARLRCFFEPFRGRAVPQDPLFPLSQAWRAEFLRDKVDVRPRDVINWAREGFRREQEALAREGGPAWLATWGRRPPDADRPSRAPSADEVRRAIDRRVARAIEEHKAERRAHPETLPPDADNLSGLVGSLLEQCRSLGPAYGLIEVERPVAARSGQQPAYDLLLRRGSAGGDEERDYLLFLVTTSATSVAGFLRRLIAALEPRSRLFLVTDQRRPLPLGAKGQKYLDTLRQRCGGRFRRADLSFAECVELDALRAVTGLARSADLEAEVVPWEPRPLSEAEVIESLHRQGRYRAAPLLGELLTP